MCGVIWRANLSAAIANDDTISPTLHPLVASVRWQWQSALQAVEDCVSYRVFRSIYDEAWLVYG